MPVTPSTNDGPADSTVLRRERAATRATDDIRVVCPTGWATPVHQLSGATRVLWEALEEPQNTAALARRVQVDPDDPYFLQAIELLVDARLFERTTA